MFKEQWNELKNLGEVIARSGTEKLDKEILDEIIARGTAQNRPLVDSLKELAEAKKTLREMKTKGLREAMENKKLADEAVREEMKALGYDYSRSEYEFNPFAGWRRIL